MCHNQISVLMENEDFDEKGIKSVWDIFVDSFEEVHPIKIQHFCHPFLWGIFIGRIFTHHEHGCSLMRSELIEESKNWFGVEKLLPFMYN